jgi:transmembrane sensor
MNDFRPSPNQDALDDQAAEWLFERENGWTAERAKEFAEWCAGDPRRAEAAKRLERTMSLLDELPAVRAPLEARLARATQPVRRLEKSPVVDFARFAWLGGMAAILMVGFVIWWGVTTQMSPREHYATDSTAQRTMALPDGSVIDINTGSDVAVQFTAKERRIILRRGEAHFQVAHNTERPFIVTAADVSVRAVGTAFDVRLAKEAVNVTVVEGRVSLGRQRAKVDKTVPEPASLLASGERALLPLDVPSAAPKIEKIDERSISALLTWYNPMTSFTDVPLRDVITRFNRRNPTQLVLEDTELGERKIGGMIALDQVEAFVRLLEQDGDVVADRTSPGRIGLRRAH